MSRKSPIRQPVFFTGEEFGHCWRSLKAISRRVQNLESIFHEAGQRSAEEFRQAIKIIRGLPKEGGEA